MNTFVITTLYFNVLYHSFVQLPANTDEFQTLFFLNLNMAACKNI